MNYTLSDRTHNRRSIEAGLANMAPTISEYNLRYNLTRNSGQIRPVLDHFGCNVTLSGPPVSANQTALNYTNILFNETQS